MNPLYGALYMQYVPEQFTLCAMVPNRYTYCNASSLQNLAVPQEFYFPLSVCGTIFGNPGFYGVELAGLKSKANTFQ